MPNKSEKGVIQIQIVLVIQHGAIAVFVQLPLVLTRFVRQIHNVYQECVAIFQVMDGGVVTIGKEAHALVKDLEIIVHQRILVLQTKI